jgi:putative acetyltransferase
MNKILIRVIQPADDPAIASVIRITLAEFGISQPGTVLGDQATNHLYIHFDIPRAVYYVVELAGKIVGGAGIYPLQQGASNIAELQKMYLLKEVRGKGIGKSLMQKCFDFARQNEYTQCYIETMPELKQAIQLYEKSGFYYLPKNAGNTGHYACHIWMMKDL